MNKREIIIIVLAVTIGVYGLLDYFVLSSKKSDNEGEKISTAINEIDTFADMARANLTIATSKKKFKNIDYLITKAETRWEKDPFIVYGSNGAVIEEKKTTEDLPELVYTGFIKAGKKMLAVVNGMEYTIGEMLKDVGYKVFRISPSRVILLTEANKEIILYLEEN